MTSDFSSNQILFWFLDVEPGAKALCPPGSTRRRTEFSPESCFLNVKEFGRMIAAGRNPAIRFCLCFPHSGLTDRMSRHQESKLRYLSLTRWLTATIRGSKVAGALSAFETGFPNQPLGASPRFQTGRWCVPSDCGYSKSRPWQSSVGVLVQAH